jgi:hypothetical protein
LSSQPGDPDNLNYAQKLRVCPELTVEKNPDTCWVTLKTTVVTNCLEHGLWGLVVGRRGPWLWLTCALCWWQWGSAEILEVTYSPRLESGRGSRGVSCEQGEDTALGEISTITTSKSNVYKCWVLEKKFILSVVMGAQTLSFHCLGLHNQVQILCA